VVVRAWLWAQTSARCSIRFGIRAGEITAGETNHDVRYHERQVFSGPCVRTFMSYAGDGLGFRPLRTESEGCDAFVSGRICHHGRPSSSTPSQLDVDCIVSLSFFSPSGMLLDTSPLLTLQICQTEHHRQLYLRLPSSCSCELVGWNCATINSISTCSSAPIRQSTHYRSRNGSQR